MSGEVGFKSVSPVIPVRDLDAALARYRRLGFSTELEEGPRYGFAERGDVSLHLIEWSEHDPARTGSHVYLYVSDADAVYAQWSSAGVMESSANSSTLRTGCASSHSGIRRGRCSASVRP